MARATKKEEEKKNKLTSKPPDWLPDGWTVGGGITETGAKFKYFLSPLSGYKFRSKKEVLHYLDVIKDGVQASEVTSCSGDNKQILIRQGESSQEWLPPGWIVEIRVQMGGGRAEKYKSYYDPITGSRFYSKAQVFRFLGSQKLSTPTLKQKSQTRDTPDNVLAQVQYSPDGLPHGWVKEILFRKSSKKRERLRKDPYYTDPVNGYIFRSLKDAIHYVSTGEVSKRAYGPRRKSMSDICSSGKESPTRNPVGKLKSLGTMVSQCLFKQEEVKSNGVMAANVDELPEKLQLPPTDHVSAESVEKADSMYSCPDTAHTNRKMKYKRRKVMEPATENMLESSKHAEERCKSLTMPRRASKRLAGCEPEKVAENMFESSENVVKRKCKLVTLPSIVGREPESATENMLETSKHADKRCESLTTQRRASKRVSGYEPEQAAENMLEISENVAKNKCKLSTLPSQASGSLAGCEPEPTTENMIVTSKDVEKNKYQLLTLPSQASKELDRCEPEPAAENMFKFSKHVEKAKPKVLTLPSQASGSLAGCEPEPTTENMLVTSKDVEKNKYKLLTLPSQASKELDRCEPEPAAENMFKFSKYVEKAKPKVLPLPRRASKRLAGCEAVPVGELVISCPSQKSISNGGQVESAAHQIEEQWMPLVVPENGTLCSDGSNGIKDKVLVAEPKSTDSIGEQSTLAEQVVTEKQNDDRPPALPAFLFLDSWSDPCIEFAVKTLMGDIPLFEDMAIPEFVSVPTSNPSSSANQGRLDQEKVPVWSERQQNQHLHVGAEVTLCPLENGLPSGIEATKSKAVTRCGLRTPNLNG